MQAKDIAFLQHGRSPLCILAGATSKDRWEDSQGMCPPQCSKQAPVAATATPAPGCVPGAQCVPRAQDLPAPSTTPSPLLCVQEHSFPFFHLIPAKALSGHGEHLSRVLTHLSDKIRHSSLATVAPSLPRYLVVIIAVNVWRLRCIF